MSEEKGWIWHILVNNLKIFHTKILQSSTGWFLKACFKNTILLVISVQLQGSIEDDGTIDLKILFVVDVFHDGVEWTIMSSMWVDTMYSRRWPSRYWSGQGRHHEIHQEAGVVSWYYRQHGSIKDFWSQ